MAKDIISDLWSFMNDEGFKFSMDNEDAFRESLRDDGKKRKVYQALKGRGLTDDTEDEFVKNIGKAYSSATNVQQKTAAVNQGAQRQRYNNAANSMLFGAYNQAAQMGAQKHTTPREQGVRQRINESQAAVAAHQSNLEREANQKKVGAPLTNAEVEANQELFRGYTDEEGNKYKLPLVEQQPYIPVTAETDEVMHGEEYAHDALVNAPQYSDEFKADIIPLMEQLYAQGEKEYNERAMTRAMQVGGGFGGSNIMADVRDRRNTTDAEVIVKQVQEHLQDEYAEKLSGAQTIQEYNKLRAELNAKMEQYQAMMVDYLVKRNTPQDTAEYWVKNLINSSVILSAASKIGSSKLERQTQAEGLASYDAPAWAKVTSGVVGMAFDAPLFQWGSSAVAPLTRNIISNMGKKLLVSEGAIATELTAEQMATRALMTRGGTIVQRALPSAASFGGYAVFSYPVQTYAQCGDYRFGEHVKSILTESVKGAAFGMYGGYAADATKTLSGGRRLAAKGGAFLFEVDMFTAFDGIEQLLHGVKFSDIDWGESFTDQMAFIGGLKAQHVLGKTAKMVVGTKASEWKNLPQRFVAEWTQPDVKEVNGTLWLRNNRKLFTDNDYRELAEFGVDARSLQQLYGNLVASKTKMEAALKKDANGETLLDIYDKVMNSPKASVGLKSKLMFLMEGTIGVREPIACSFGISKSGDGKGAWLQTFGANGEVVTSEYFANEESARRAASERSIGNNTAVGNMLTLMRDVDQAIVAQNEAAICREIGVSVEEMANIKSKRRGELTEDEKVTLARFENAYKEMYESGELQKTTSDMYGLDAYMEAYREGRCTDEQSANARYISAEIERRADQMAADEELKAWALGGSADAAQTDIYATAAKYAMERRNAERNAVVEVVLSDGRKASLIRGDIYDPTSELVVKLEDGTIMQTTSNERAENVHVDAMEGENVKSVEEAAAEQARAKSIETLKVGQEVTLLEDGDPLTSGADGRKMLNRGRVVDVDKENGRIVVEALVDGQPTGVRKTLTMEEAKNYISTAKYGECYYADKEGTPFMIHEFEDGHVVVADMDGKGVKVYGNVEEARADGYEIVDDRRANTNENANLNANEAQVPTEAQANENANGNENKAPQPQPQRAIDKLPLKKDGKTHDFVNAEPTDVADALVELAKGDHEKAKKAAENLVAMYTKDLEAAKQRAEKGVTPTKDPEADMTAEAKLQEEVEAAQRIVDHFNEVRKQIEEMERDPERMMDNINANENLNENLNENANEVGDSEVEQARQLADAIGFAFGTKAMNENGSENYKKREIWLNEAHKKGIAAWRTILGHELTHAIKDVNSGEGGNLILWRELRKHVMDAMGEEWERKIAECDALYNGEKYHLGLDRHAIEEEVISDWIGENLFEAEPERVKALIDKVSKNNGNAEGFLSTIVNALDRCLEAVRKVFGVESEQAVAVEMAKRTWESMYEYAARLEKDKQMAAEENARESNEKHSLRVLEAKPWENDGERITDKDVMEQRGEVESVKHSIKDVDGNEVAVSYDDHVEFNTNTWRKEKEKVRRMLIEDAGLDSDEAQYIIDSADKVADAMKEFQDKYPLFREFSERDASKRPILRDAGEYLSWDYSFNCVKKDAMNSVMDILVEEGRSGNLGQTQVEALKSILQKHGYLTPCVMCYVEAKRKVLKQSKENEQRWNAMCDALGIREMMGETKPLSESQMNMLREFSEGKNLERIEGYRSADGKEGIIPADVIKKQANLMLKNEELRGRMDYRWMMSPSAYTKFYDKFGNAGLFNLLQTGQYKGKGLLESSPFSVDTITEDLKSLMFNPRYVRLIGGMRQFSYEDARAFMFFDYYQQLALMEGARLCEHAYTKRPFFPEMFGKTGVKINQSLIVDCYKGEDWHREALGLNEKEYKQWLRDNAGFIPRGSLDKSLQGEEAIELVPYWSNESFPLEEALNNSRNEEFDGNVGNTFVAPSRKAIIWALDNKDIHQVLAYHANGASPLMKSLTGYDNAEGFDNGYHTLGKDGKAISDFEDNESGIVIKGRLLNWNKLLIRHNYNAKEAADAYLQFCKDKGWSPMFNYEGVVDHENYYKMLTDFRNYKENGEPSPQRRVKTTLPDNWKEVLDKHLAEESGRTIKAKNVENNAAMMDEIRKATKYTSIESEERAGTIKVLESIYGKGNVEIQDRDTFNRGLDDVVDGGTAQMLRDSGGYVYGYAVGERIVLNDFVFNANTPMHEHTHIYMKVLKTFNKKLYDKGLELWRDTELWKDVKDGLEYMERGDVSDDRVFSEVMSQFTGGENEKVIGEITGITDKNWLSRAVDFFKEMWKNIKSSFESWSSKDLNKLTAEEFANMPLRAFYDEVERAKYTERLTEYKRAKTEQGDAETSAELMFGKPSDKSEGTVADDTKYSMSHSIEEFDKTQKRAVALNEVKAAVVPKGTDKALVAKLKQEGIKVVTYDKNVEGSRVEAVDNAAKKQNIKFSLPKEDMYRRKQAYADNLHAKNKEIGIENGMTEEQANALEELAKARHELHKNYDRVIDSDEGKYKENLLSAIERVENSGLERPSFIGDNGDYIDIDDILGLYEYGNVPKGDTEYSQWLEEERTRIGEELGTLNSDIERYLEDIDRKFGTKYAPTGMSRFSLPKEITDSPIATFMKGLADRENDVDNKRRVEDMRLLNNRLADDVKAAAERIRIASDLDDDALVDKRTEQAFANAEKNATASSALAEQHIRGARKNEAKFRQEMQNQMTALAKRLMVGMGGADQSVVNKLLTELRDVQNITNPSELVGLTQRIIDTVLEQRERKTKEMLNDALKVRGKGTSASGGNAMKSMDEAHAKTIEGLKSRITMNMGADEIANEKQRLQQMKSEFDTDGMNEVERAKYDEITRQLDEIQMYEGYRMAVADYDESIRALKKELADAETNQERHAIMETIIEERAKKLKAMSDYIVGLKDFGAEGVKGKRDFLADRQKMEDDVNHAVNSDTKGLPVDAEYNGGIPWAGGLSTLNGIMKFFGRRAADGKGRLWHMFIPAHQEAIETRQLGIEAADAMLNDIAKKHGYKTWSDMGKYAKNNSGKLVQVLAKRDGKHLSLDENGKPIYEVKESELPLDNLLYIHACEKMADGRMKLRKMGISEDEVERIRDWFREDPKRKALMDAIDECQGNVLSQLKDKYNVTHRKLFGVAMSDVEDYFPLRLDKREVNKGEQVGGNNGDVMPSVMTGAIKKRVRNSLPLDITGTGAFEVTLAHILEMETWNAFAPLKERANMLLNNKNLKYSVDSMKGIYGSGQTLMKTLKKNLEIATECYKPDNSSTTEMALLMQTGITMRNISFNLNTARKQLTSIWAELGYASPEKILRNVFRKPLSNYFWAMENLPSLRARRDDADMGYAELKKLNADNNLFKVLDKLKGLGRLGMMPNRYVDLWVCAHVARACYDEQLAYYKKSGLSKEVAERKARLDAEIAFNETQQSSQGAFLSELQSKHSVGSTIFTTYRNSPMSYQRVVIDASRNLRRMATNKQEMLDQRYHMWLDEGVSEQQAMANAKRDYVRGFCQNIGQLAAVFTMNLSWYMSPTLAYMFLGNDDEKKKEYAKNAFWLGITDDFVQGIPGFGQAFGQYVSNVQKRAGTLGKAAMAAWEGDWKALTRSAEDLFPQMLLFEDVEDFMADLTSGEIVRMASGLSNHLVSIGFGANPKLVGNVVNGVLNASKYDMDASKKWMFGLMSVMSHPKDAQEQLFVDLMLDALGDDYAERVAASTDGKVSVKGMEQMNEYYDEIRRAWIEFNRGRDLGLFGIGYDAEKTEEDAMEAVENASEEDGSHALQGRWATSKKSEERAIKRLQKLINERNALHVEKDEE